MEKTGVDYIPRLTSLTQIENELILKFGGLKAYGFLNRLENMITGSGSCGYYMKIFNSTYDIIAQDFKCDVSYVRNVMRFLTNSGYYNLEMFKKYNILTNHKIQENVLITVYGSRKKWNFGNIIKEYILDSIIPELKKKAVFQEFFGVESIKGNETEQNLSNNTKEKETTNIDLSESTIKESSLSKINLFKKYYPNKIMSTNFIVPKFVDIKLLIQKFKESPGFLEIANNMQLEYFCSQKKYMLLVNNYYKSISKPEKKLAESRATYSGSDRKYSEEDFNNLFDKVEDIKI